MNNSFPSNIEMNRRAGVQTVFKAAPNYCAYLLLAKIRNFLIQAPKLTHICNI